MPREQSAASSDSAAAPISAPHPSGSGARSAGSPPRITDHQLIRPIGVGSYGEVWLARSALGTLRAVKIVYRAQFESDRPFDREFKGIQNFEPVSRQHEGLVDILHVGRGEGFYYYVMELADDAGGRAFPRAMTSAPPEDLGLRGRSPSQAQILDLDSYTPKTLRSELQHRGRLPVKDCLAIGRALVDALVKLHRHHLIHRDIKPSNIIFVNGAPKLADVGLVAEVSEARSFVGTTGYIPPEGPGTPLGDLYSLGKVLYEISTGRDRHDFPQLPPILRELPDADSLVELNEIVLRACEDDPKRRYTSAAELAADLGFLQAGRSVKRLHLMERRLLAARKVLLALATLLLVAGGLYWAAARQARTTLRQLYVADMNRAVRAWEAGDLAHARDLLEQHRRRQPEMLGFEWRLARELCQEAGNAHVCTGHADFIESVAVSSDGKLFASGGRDRRVNVWEAATGKHIRSLDAEDIVHSVSFSPENRLLVIGGRDMVLHVWDITSWERKFAMRGHQEAIRAVAFFPDGQTLVSGAEDQTIRFWDMSTGTERVAERVADEFKIEGLALSPNGDFLASCGFSTRVRLWRLNPLQRLPDLEVHTASAMTVAFSHDGRLLASGGFDGPVQLWDLKNQRSFGQLGLGAPIRNLSFSPDGQTIATAARDSLIHLWNLDTRLEIDTLRGHGAEVSSLAFTADGKTLVSGSDDRTARIWAIKELAARRDLLAHRALVNAIAFSPDSRALLTAEHGENRLHVWDVRTGVETTNFHAPTGAVWCVAVSRDGRTAATGGVGQDTGARLWDLTGVQPPVLLGQHGGGIEMIAFSPDGATLATASRDQTVKLWDVVQRNEKATLAGNFGVMRCVAFSPDGRWLAAGSRDGVVRLWPVDNPVAPMEFPDHVSEVWSVAFSHDGRWLASGDVRRKILLWDMDSRRVVATLQGHAALISSLAFSPDDRTLASGSWDSTVKLWNLRLRAEVATLHGHVGQVTSVAFSADGNVLASASGDGKARLWRATPQANIGTH